MNWWRILFTTWKFGREREMFSVSCSANASFRMLLGPENILFLGHPNNWRGGGFCALLENLMALPPLCMVQRAKVVWGKNQWSREKWSWSDPLQWCAVIIEGKGNGQAIVLLLDMRCEMKMSFSHRVYLITKHCHVPSCSEVLSQVSHHPISSSTTFTWRWIFFGKLRQMIEAFQK